MFKSVIKMLLSLSFVLIEEVKRYYNSIVNFKKQNKIVEICPFLVYFEKVHVGDCDSFESTTSESMYPTSY